MGDGREERPRQHGIEQAKRTGGGRVHKMDLNGGRGGGGGDAILTAQKLRGTSG